MKSRFKKAFSISRVERKGEMLLLRDVFIFFLPPFLLLRYTRSE